jgi:hypothetical protein
MAVVLCANEPFTADDEATWLGAVRTILVAELTAPRRDVDAEPTRPLHAYAVLFGERPHVSIQRRVRALYTTWRRRRAPIRGFVYVYRDVRDGRPSRVKLGSTTNVERRMAQWRAELGGARVDELGALFDAPCDDMELAELTLHALLFCQWQSHVTNKYTGARLLEYFDVANLTALRLLVTAVCRHVDWRTRMYITPRGDVIRP